MDGCSIWALIPDSFLFFSFVRWLIRPFLSIHSPRPLFHFLCPTAFAFARYDTPLFLIQSMCQGPTIRILGNEVWGDTLFIPAPTTTTACLHCLLDRDIFCCFREGRSKSLLFFSLLIPILIPTHPSLPSFLPLLPSLVCIPMPPFLSRLVFRIYSGIRLHTLWIPSISYSTVILYSTACCLLSFVFGPIPSPHTPF